MAKEQVEQVRRFNRTVAERVGVLHDHYPVSPVSLLHGDPSVPVSGGNTVAAGTRGDHWFRPRVTIA
ncbi:hypothetical protein AB0K53_02555 [Streptomyces tuirus]|uniref:hypothetical protein n=1 Tax=Streptomyces tuirus TaxID=68278 RepID=UPI0034233016